MMVLHVKHVLGSSTITDPEAKSEAKGDKERAKVVETKWRMTDLSNRGSSKRFVTLPSPLGCESCVWVVIPRN